MTPYENIYESFIALIEDDEWATWEEWEAAEDWKQLLIAAVPWFKFPRVSLQIGEDGFAGDLGNSEIQIIVAFMKVVWLDRVVLSWENMQPLYSERDFSPAAMLDKFRLLRESQLKTAKQLESIYYRSRDGKPFPYSKLSGR